MIDYHPKPGWLAYLKAGDYVYLVTIKQIARIIVTPFWNGREYQFRTDVDGNNDWWVLNSNGFNTSLYFKCKMLAYPVKKNSFFVVSNIRT